jgi:hypothetical protein
VRINKVTEVVYELERGVGDQLEFKSLNEENFLLLQEFDIANVLEIDDSHESLDVF